MTGVSSLLLLLGVLGSILFLINGEIVDSVTTSNENEDLECGVWFAKSTIPGAGLGMYAGRNFSRKSFLLETGDSVIPLVDIGSFGIKDDDWMFLWEEYTWDAETLMMDNEGDDVNAASFGFGAAVNCMLELVNVKETGVDYHSLGFHRSKDPGAGAFSPYHNRQTYAKIDIREGHELFASYGESWFKTRTGYIPPVPLRGDLSKAQKLLQGLSRLHLPKNITFDLWKSFVATSPFNDTSRILFGIPKQWEEMMDASKMGLLNYHRNKATRPLSWIRQNGVCGDNLVEGASTLPQAGRGAFLRRFLPKGNLVAPFPLIHIPYRKELAMPYDKDHSGSASHQLILNYCMGHPETTMILCPYGTLTALINHNQSLANVRVQWADPSRSNHHPDWLNQTVPFINKQGAAGLAMELVALRDLEAGEEIFMDYGDEWEAAWKKHMKEWEPVDGAEKYISAEYLNSRRDQDVLKTEFEQMHDPYPNNVVLRFDFAFKSRRWKKHWELGTLAKFIKDQDEYWYDCDILRRETDDDGNIWYSGVVNNSDGKKEEDKKFEKVPIDAFHFVDQPYTTDMHLPNAFRHEIGIPDDMVPRIWRNVEQSSEGHDEL